MYRTPTAGVVFGSVAVNWYMRQGDRPLVGTRGQLVDHFALSVANLDAWMTKLRAESVKILAGLTGLATFGPCSSRDQASKRSNWSR